MNRIHAFGLAAAALLAFGTASPAPAAVQDTVEAARVDSAASSSNSAIYQRERFVYPTDRRRNPFQNLLELEDAGPRFEDLDLVGNARVVEIRPDEVVFSVTSFGVTRSETLRIRKRQERRG